ncbi:hypothetical protein CEXT_132471 [Caerostris extrusa]|uniref:Uncharacterized protein n=1 Tax=Caerostris extrusa TaxID=172846 RepID=A0AAV4XR01_CAEEX|nr:hypothetical protein CEXT_132471 [Caerostris extrusa]
MKFSKGCSRVLELMQDLGDEVEDYNSTSTSDISGYHSDSDSTIVVNSQNSGCKRYNLMYQSDKTLLHFEQRRRFSVKEMCMGKISMSDSCM